MSLSAQLINIFYLHRRGEIDYFMRHPGEVQKSQLAKLLNQAQNTVFGKEHQFSSIKNYEQFASSVDIQDYDSFSKYIERSRSGEKSVTWPTQIKWFAKSSGTTESRSKFIPVSDEGLRDCHLQGPMDVICFYSGLYPKSNMLAGKTLTLGGSRRVETLNLNAKEGDLSAILIENTPKWANFMRVPSAEIALIPDFEEKVQAICKETVDKNVTAFAGVPSWNLVLMNKVLEYTSKSNILEVWPNMDLFIHGGMNFKPYKEQYKRLFPSENMKYMDTYNASEGFFAIQNDPHSDDMLLMLDYGVFYEFLPLADINNHSKAVPIEGVELGVNYAMIISTCNGLWRYMIGDTVEFTSLTPHKIKITGRTKHFINAFGEEVIIDNAENALQAACLATGAQIVDYTAGPIYMSDKTKGSHQWIIEFAIQPLDILLFKQGLDDGLRAINSDYDAKRFHNTTLLAPTITVVPTGTFYGWMKSNGKSGGQNKVPRLSNDRTYLDQILNI